MQECVLGIEFQGRHKKPEESDLPGPDPWLCVLAKAITPESVLLGSLGEESSLLVQLFTDRPDVVGLESTASSDVTDTHIIGFTGVTVALPTGQDTWLQS